LLCLRNARAFPLLPAALASVSFGFVLVRVRVPREMIKVPVCNLRATNRLKHSHMNSLPFLLFTQAQAPRGGTSVYPSGARPI